VGYANEASFGRAFRRTFGIAPGGYRRPAPETANSPGADAIAESARPLA
jgi:transcriptional regulator GlxA family with amidase domain